MPDRTLLPAFEVSSPNMYSDPLHRPFAVILVQGVIAAMVLLLSSFLAYTNKLEGEAVTALFGMGIALAGQTAATASASAQRQGVQPPTRVTTPEGVTVETNGAIGTTERLAEEASEREAGTP